MRCGDGGEMSGLSVTEGDKDPRGGRRGGNL